MSLDRGTANLSELANLQGVTSPTMSSMVSTLVERGWIQREHSETDRRMIVLRVTPEGRNVLENARSILTDAIVKLFGSLTEEELDTLNDGLAILYHTLPLMPNDST